MQTDIYKYFGKSFNATSIEKLAATLLKMMSEGNICIHFPDLTDEEKEKYNYQGFLNDLDNLIEKNIISQDPNGKTPFIFVNERLYLQRYFQYEQQIVKSISGFVNAGNDLLETRREELRSIREFIITHFRSLDEKTGNGPDYQLIVALQAYQNNYSIITGGPGVGKTTSIKKLLTILLKIKPDLKVALCAPTGKAAQRMKESLFFNPAIEKVPPSEIVEKIDAIKEKASTIHLLLKSLKFKDNSPYFTYHKDNPLNVEVVIVDESSMIDVALFAKLLDAIPSTARVIFLGDKDQLVSVEAASIFGDICSSIPLNKFDASNVQFLNEFLEGIQQVGASQITNDTHVLTSKMTQLTHSHRFKSNDGIGIMTKAVINEDIATVNTFLNNEDEQVKIDTQYQETTYNALFENYKGYIEILRDTTKAFDLRIKEAIESFNQFRILTAIREGAQGIQGINKKVEHKLANWFPGIFRTDLEFYEYRPVMVTKNNYNVSPTLFNGDTGIIAKDEKDELKAWFEKDGKIIPYACGFLGKVETNFAQTIHKSQGSEYPKVLVVMPKNKDILILTKELLYTGVSRGKSKVTLMANEDIIATIVGKKVQRVSGIISQLKN